jgi:signal transduction histidine kinase
LLVKNLLLLYRIDSTTTPPVTEPGDMASICRQALSQYESLMAERSVRVKANVQTGVLFTAPPTHMDVLVRNLIENAAKYAVPGSEIVLDLSANAGKAQLQFYNECPSNPEWDTDVLFEPFGRLDVSRNSKTGGTGLGLAICKAIATANKWDFSLRQESNGVRAVLGFSTMVDDPDVEAVSSTRPA